MKTQGNKPAKTKISGKNELKESQIWNSDRMDELNEFILSESKKQSPERRLKNELLSIKYQMQDYIEKDKVEHEMKVLDFVRLYLKLLKITQRELAAIFEMKDTNLYKYLTGERKLNWDIAFKLSSFSHTQPELWYNIQTKNELYELKNEKNKLKEYEKFDYKNFVSVR